MNNPTSWPNLEISLEWLRQFDADIEILRLPAGSYYAGEAHDLWMQGDDEAAEEAIFVGRVGDLIRLYEALAEAEAEGRGAA